eukprot:9469204-Pyramimonas_sp.AAC.1
MSAVIDVLKKLQASASKSELGFDESGPAGQTAHKERLQMKALKRLQEGQEASLVDVTLSGFEHGGITVPSVLCKMPVNISPEHAMIELRGECLLWVWMKHRAWPKSAKRLYRPAADFETEDDDNDDDESDPKDGGAKPKGKCASKKLSDRICSLEARQAIRREGKSKFNQ